MSLSNDWTDAQERDYPLAARTFLLAAVKAEGDALRAVNRTAKRYPPRPGLEEFVYRTSLRSGADYALASLKKRGYWRGVPVDRTTWFADELELQRLERELDAARQPVDSAPVVLTSHREPAPFWPADPAEAAHLHALTTAPAPVDNREDNAP